MNRGLVEQVAGCDRHVALVDTGKAQRAEGVDHHLHVGLAHALQGCSDPTPRFDAARLTTGPAARLLQNIVIVAALFILFAVFAALRVPTQTGTPSSLTVTPYRPALADHPRLNRGSLQGIPTCAPRWGCA